MAEQPTSNRALWIAVPVAAVVLAGLLFWLFSPEVPQAPTPAPVAPPPVVAAATPPPIEAPEVEAAPEREVPTRDAWEDERDAAIPTTDKCYDIMSLKWQGTPDFIALELIRDRGMIFLEDDLACLTAEGANPAILDHVERYQDRRQFLDKYKND